MLITAMTYNIASGHNLAGQRDMRFCASVINEVRPDFVVLNEVRSHTCDVPGINQADEAGRLTGFYPVFGKSIDIQGGDYGNAFLTRFPLLETQIIHIPDRRSEEKVYYEHRTVMRNVISINGAPVTVLGTHFGLARCEQESAVETVLSLLRAEKNPVILMGDLNLRPNDPILQPLYSVLSDSAGAMECPPTFPSGAPNRKIDYIMARGLSIVSQRTLPTQCSDHRPLTAKLVL